MNDVRAVPSGVFRLLPLQEVRYGSGALSGLADVLAAQGISRALLITGHTLAESTPLVDRVCAAAGGRIASVFTGTIQHVHRQSVLEAAECARRLGADGIVSFGGGTPNDTGKAVLLALAEQITHTTGFDASRVRFTYPAAVDVPPVRGEALPMVAIPTTLSGGEFTHFAGITDETRRVKDLYVDPKLTARAVILDPDLTVHTPETLWLSSGMRAVDHCIEALCSTNAHPFTDALAAHALPALNRTLRACRQDPMALLPRHEAQIAAWMSVCGLANVNLGLSHGLGHQLGARNNVPHGVTSCVMMPAVMDFNASYVADRHSFVARLLGQETSGLPVQAAAKVGREAVAGLVHALGLPHRLREVGVTREDFPALANDALEDLIVATNPRPVRSVEEVIAVLEAAY